MNVIEITTEDTTLLLTLTAQQKLLFRTFLETINEDEARNFFPPLMEVFEVEEITELSTILQGLERILQ